MKLHLPKSLLLSLLSALTLASPLAVTLGSSAWAGWAADRNTGGYAYYYDESNSSTSTVDKLTVPVSSGDVANWNPHLTMGLNDVFICSGYGGDNQPSGYSGQISTIGKIVAQDGTSLTIAVNPWQGWKFYTSLTIEELEFGGGTGSGSFNVNHAADNVIVNAVSGTLSSVNNAGNLTLGSVTMGGNITNDGVLNLAGTLTGSGTISNGQGGVVRIDTTGVLSGFKGVTYTDANDNVSTTNVGFITGVQTIRVLDGVTYEGAVYVNDSDTETTLTEDGYITANVGDSKIFYVADTWDYDADQATGATSYYVTETGTLNFSGSTAAGGMTINSEGTVALTAETTLTGTVTVNGGTFTTSSQKLNGDKLVLNGVSSATISGDRTLSTNLELNNTYLTIGAEDTFDYDDTSALTFKIGSGATLDVQSYRQSVRSNHIIEMAGGTLKGAGGANGVYTYGIDFYNGGRFNTSANSRIETNVGAHNSGNIRFDVNTGVTLTMTGNLVGGGTFSKTAGGTMVYSGAVFNQALTISGGVFEYNFTGERTHTGSITGAGTLRKSGAGTLTLSSANTTVTNLAVTAGKLVYNVAEGEKTHTLSGTGGTFEKAGDGTLSFKSQNTIYTGKTTISGGKIALDLGADEDGSTTNSTYTLGGAVDGSGTLSVKAGTTLENNSKTISSALELDGGDVMLKGDKVLSGSVTIKDGSTLSIDVTSGSDHVNYGNACTITIEAGGEFAIGANRETFGGWTLNLKGGTVSGEGATGDVGTVALDYHANSTINALTGDSSIEANVGVRGGNTLTVDVSKGATLDISGNVAGNGNVSKSGAGDLIFTCDHTYTGTTEIRAGSLVLNLGSNGIYTLDNDVTGDGTLQVNAGTIVKTEGHNVQSALYLNGGSLMVTAAGSADDTMLPTSSSVVVSDNASITFTKALSTSTDLTITGGAGSVTLSGEQNTIKGALTITEGTGLTLDADSALTVNSPIQNNGTLDIQGTVNWNLASTEGLTVTYSEAELGRPDNGLGVGVIKGLITTGNGTLVDHGEVAVTVNDKTGTLATNTGLVTVDDVVYYVMGPAKNENDGYEYSMFGEYANSSDVVYVGVHTYPSPIANADANNALGFYVGENGILGIIGDSNTMSSGEILAQTQGEGTIILRAPGTGTEKDENEMRENLYVTVDSETQFIGNLSIATQLLKSSAKAETKSVYLHLENGADISSFSSIEMGNGTHIVLDGIIEKSESKKGHINNLTNSGSGFTYLYINPRANEELVLGGDTTLRMYAHKDYEQGSYMRLVFNQNAQVTIENLTTGGDTLENMYWNTLEITSAYETLYANDKVVNGIVNIESFDYLGFIYLSAGTEGSILANLNLKAWQTLYDYQYSRDITAVGDKGLIIKGEGTYVLSEGNSILSNFGVLSTEFTEDGARIWQGTVEVNNLDASGAGIKIADYGNEKSKIHFKGFKGYLTDNATAVEIKPALVLENTYNEDGSLNMSGYEITGGGEEQAQTYTGVISGTGDFVVSAAENMTFNLQGNLSEWVADGTETPEFIVQNGTQTVNFSDAATVINADVLATNGATMNADISNTKSAVTVNGKVKADGGTLNLSVNTEQGTTFNESVVASSLTTYTNTTAQFKGETTRIGKVNLSAVKDAEAAVIEHGMKIFNGNTVQGGEARNTVMSFEGEGYVSDAKLTNVVLTSTGSITELQEKVSINLKKLHAEDVYLSGAVNFESLDTQDNFKFVETIEAFGQTYNEVRFESSSFSDMTLAIAELGYLGNITLTVANGITVADSTEVWKGTDAPTNVSIFLEGFTVEGLTIGKRMEGMFAPLQFKRVDGAQVVALSEDTAMSVSQLLKYDSYLEVYFVQQEDGLFIRMSNIPEPTTATLSLLALAALAARRRRQK